MKPLAGTRVVEFCEVAAGPFCGMVLADMGADVIKVERPGVGDTMRFWPPISNGFSENFASLNRNKRSITLSLKEPEELEALQRLAGTADVMIENYRPGVLSRYGLGFEDLRHRNSRLVYASISAFGHVGPRAREGGFDLTIQAMSGVMSVTGEPDGRPVKCGVPISDMAAGLYAAYAVAAALVKVGNGGEGRHIDVSMLGATLGISALQTSEYFGTGRSPQRLGSAHPRNAPYQAFQAKDGYFALAAGNDRLWHKVCDLLEEPDLKADPRFVSTSDRARNQGELKALLEVKFAEADVELWVERFGKAGVPCAPINSYADILSDPHVTEAGWVKDLTLPGGTQTKTFDSPIRMSDEPANHMRPPPELGAHTHEVLEELKLSKD